jgi:hypothetical protein
VLLELFKPQMEQARFVLAPFAARGNIPLDQERLPRENAICVLLANTNLPWGRRNACRAQPEGTPVVWE